MKTAIYTAGLLIAITNPNYKEVDNAQLLAGFWWLFFVWDILELIFLG